MTYHDTRLSSILECGKNIIYLSNNTILYKECVDRSIR